MSAELQHFIDKPVNVITCDGRVIVGILKGYDQAMNLVLSHSHERIFSMEEPVSVDQLGVYLIRGENVYAISLIIAMTNLRGCSAVVGMIDDRLDGSIEYEKLKAAPIASVIH